jgi:hypothetical protein
MIGGDFIGGKNFKFEGTVVVVKKWPILTEVPFAFMRLQVASARSMGRS